MFNHIKRYLWAMLISLDQTLLNVLPSPLWNLLLKPKHLFGKPDETLSSVMGKNKPTCGFCRKFCRILSIVFFDKLHCEDSIERDE